MYVVRKLKCVLANVRGFWQKTKTRHAVVQSPRRTKTFWKYDTWEVSQIRPPPYCLGLPSPSPFDRKQENLYYISYVDDRLPVIWYSTSPPNFYVDQ
jgi:hypothetical protein